MNKKQITVLCNDELLKILAYYLDEHFNSTDYAGNDKQQAKWVIVEIQNRLNNKLQEVA
jgi:hypothetical protein